MSVKKRKAKPIRNIRTKQVILDFDAERLKAPFLLRFGAVFIDYILLISIPVISLLLSRFSEVPDAKLLNNEITNGGWLIMILLAITNFVIFPMFSGQSIGKMLTGLRIVNSDGTTPAFSSLLIRHLIGYPLTLLTGGLGLIISIFNGKGRALHDYLAGTVVVYGRRKIEKKVKEVGKVQKIKDDKAQKRLAVESGG